MQFPFSVDFIPTFNLFTSSIAVSGKQCFQFKSKDTSDITSIALENTLPKVYLASVQIPLGKRNSAWTELMREKEEQSLKLIVPGTVYDFHTVD